MSDMYFDPRSVEEIARGNENEIRNLWREICWLKDRVSSLERKLREKEKEDGRESL